MKIATIDSKFRESTDYLAGAGAFFASIREGSSLLYILGWAHLILALLLLPAMLVDDRLVQGLNVWIKPFKFAVSIGVYLWTAAWFMAHSRDLGRRRGILAWTIALTMLVEIALIGFQAARGTTSHFNNATALDGAIFGFMGTAIQINTLANFYLLYLFTRKKFISVSIASTPALLWGLRLGLFFFILGALEGGVMVGLNRHTVGASDGGLGIPLIGWSANAGDLRIAHFLGLHALQAVPLFAWFMHGRGSRGAAPVVIFALGYFALVTGLFIQAMMGRPLFPA